jgi:hypothetical protein
MTALTACSANVFWNGVKVAKMRNITPSIQRNELDTTGIGECEATSAYGLRRDTVSGELLYDPGDPATRALMNRIFAGNSTNRDVLRIQMQTTGQSLSGDAIITSLSMPIQVGELMVAQISASISGGFNKGETTPF